MCCTDTKHWFTALKYRHCVYYIYPNEIVYSVETIKMLREPYSINENVVLSTQSLGPDRQNGVQMLSSVRCTNMLWAGIS